MATLKLTNAIGTHTAYAKFIAASGVPAMQSDNMSYIIGKVEGLSIPQDEIISSTSSGFILNTPTPNLLWAAYDGATSYNIQISSSSIFPDNITTTTHTYDFITSDASISISWPSFSPAAFQLVPGKKYFWRIQAIIPTGTSMWSAHKAIIYKNQ